VLTLGDTVTLSNGVLMPRLGFGTYKARGDEAARAVATALEVGYRGIDTAAIYDNEESVGQGLRAGGVAREDVFVATKVWTRDMGYESTRKAFAGSLERLGLDYVDLYLIHWPVEGMNEETWRAMEGLLDEGLTRAIGVCNFLAHHIQEAEAYASVMPMVNQFEFHPRLQQLDVLKACMERGIVVQAWAPLMKGKVLEIPEIARIGERHGKSAIQVTLRWVLQHGVVTIPKSVNPDHIRQNADIFDFELDVDEMTTIDALDRGERLGAHPDHHNQW